MKYALLLFAAFSIMVIGTSCAPDQPNSTEQGTDVGPAPANTNTDTATYNRNRGADTLNPTLPAQPSPGSH